MAGTDLYYNGVLLQDCQIREFVQDIEYDESGSDPLYSRFRISVSSTLVALSDASTAVNPLPEERRKHPSTIDMKDAEAEEFEEPTPITMPSRLHLIEKRLSIPRKDFWLAVNNATINPAVPQSPKLLASTSSPYRILVVGTGTTIEELDRESGGPSTSNQFIESFNGITDVPRDDVIDCHHGPKPMRVDVQRILGGHSLEVHFTIECVRLFCKTHTAEEVEANSEIPPVNDARKSVGVISNKWSVTESLDSDWNTTHIVEGVLVVRDHRYKAHAMRTIVTPYLFPYAKLDGREYSVDRTGLKLTYRHTIKETGDAPPSGILDWKGTYTETNAIGDGRNLGSISITVRGTTNPPAGKTRRQQKQMMIRLLYAIALGRISGLNQLWEAKPGQNAKLVQMFDGTIVEQMHAPVMEFRASVRYADDDLTGFDLRLRNMGDPMPIPDYDPKWWPVPEDFQWDITSENEASGEEGARLGSYLIPYGQFPCSDFHGIPRGAAVEELTDAIPKEFVAYLVPHIDGTTGMVDAPLDPAPATTRGISAADQLAGFQYLAWDSHVKHEMDEGIVGLPLSKARAHPTAGGVQTAVPIRLHAGIGYREIKCIASRLGEVPELPIPARTITTEDGAVEDYLDGTFVAETPKIDKDLRTMVYTVQCRWRYLRSQPAMYELSQGNGSTQFLTRYLQMGSSPIDRTNPDTNLVRMGKLFGNPDKIYKTSAPAVLS